MQQFTPIPRILIEQELDKILSSKGFVNSPILCRFLRYIVSKTLDGRQREIKEYTIGTEVLDKAHDFNRTTDPSVRIHAIRLRKQLEEYYGLRANDAVVRIEIPKGTYIPEFSLFQVVDAPAERNGYYSAKSREKGWRKKICFFPFDLLQQTEQFGFSADQLGICMTATLGHFQEVEVIPYLPVLALLEAGHSHDTVVKDLGVNYYFHGSISVEADTVLVELRLYESTEDMLIWSHTYQFNSMASAPDLELEKISSRVASTICGYSGLLFARHGEQSIEAGYGSIQEEALHLYYRNQIHNNADTFHPALQRIEWLVKTYGDCSWCYAILASMYADGVVYGYLLDADSIERSRVYTARALELDPDHQHALFARAWLIVMSGDREGAMVAIDRMHRINPHAAFFNMTIAIGLCFIGEYEKSTKLVKDLLEVIPVPSWWIHVPHTIASIKKRDFRAALFHAKKIGRLNTIFDSVFEIIAVYHLGDFHELRELVSKYHNRFPSGLKYLQRAFTFIFHDDDLKMLMNETIAGILFQVGYRKSAV
jgi:TolB-like protein